VALTRRDLIKQAALSAAAAGLPMGCATAAGPVSAGPEGLDPFARLDATEQARLVRRREVSPRELAEAAIARIETLDGSLNAVVSRAFERGLALAEAPLPEGPFRGVPYLFKDLMDWEGVRTTFGSRLFAGNIARKTDEAARRMLATGLVPLGKTNTPELGLLPTTQSQLLGPAHNPWNPAFDPGGSSGGAAVAVASGMVPIASASDGGGSIRVPACNTGLFGFKPSRGRIPPRTVRPGQLSVIHCVSRSVRDSETLLEAIHITSAEGSELPPPVHDPEQSGRGLRIAWSTRSLYGAATHPDCVTAVESAARLCESLGHHVEDASPDLDADAFIDHFLTFWSLIPSALVDRITQQSGSPPPRDGFEPWTWGLVERFRKLPADAVARAVDHMAQLARQMERFHQRYDVWLTPVLSKPALRSGELDGNTPYAEALEEAVAYVAFTPIANATGQPSMSVPLHWNAHNLPIGALFTGRVGEEATLLALARQLERARPWAQRWPGVSAARGSSSQLRFRSGTFRFVG
jgi:amidase